MALRSRIKSVDAALYILEQTSFRQPMNMMLSIKSRLCSPPIAKSICQVGQPGQTDCSPSGVGYDATGICQVFASESGQRNH